VVYGIAAFMPVGDHLQYVSVPLVSKFSLKRESNHCQQVKCLLLEYGPEQIVRSKWYIPHFVLVSLQNGGLSEYL
jgi:hypothetical protein